MSYRARLAMVARRELARVCVLHVCLCVCLCVCVYLSVSVSLCVCYRAPIATLPIEALSRGYRGAIEGLSGRELSAAIWGRAFERAAVSSLGQSAVSAGQVGGWSSAAWRLAAAEPAVAGRASA